MKLLDECEQTLQLSGVYRGGDSNFVAENRPVCSNYTVSKFYNIFILQICRLSLYTAVALTNVSVTLYYAYCEVRIIYFL